MKPCMKCGASDEFSDDPMCAETQIASGRTIWLCYDCRSEWYSEIRRTGLYRKYQQAMFRMECWKSSVVRGMNSDVNEGLKLLDDVLDIEDDIDRWTEQWLVT